MSTAGGEAIEVAEVAGLYLDPWEQLVLTDALGETDDGRWAAYRVGLCVPRQNGKGAVLEARELAGLFAFGERLIIHSAHEQATATEHFNRLLNLMEGVPEFDRRILKASRGKGQEAIILRDGFRIFFKTRTGGGGRGFTGDLVVFDEAMILAAAFMAALVPTMAARSMEGDPQLWFTGSAVDQQKTEHGIEFSRVRSDAFAGVDRLAYFDWSAEGDDPSLLPLEVLDDPAVWAAANPGLGIRISEQYVADERRALGSREFAVERLGVGDWPDPSEDANQEISDEAWTALKDRSPTERQGAVCFAFDVNPERTRACIAVGCHRHDGLEYVEVVEHENGTGWLVDRLAQLVERHDPEAIVCDARGPAASFIDALEDRGVRVEALDSQDYARACGSFVDSVDAASFRHPGTPELRSALKSAGKRSLGDAWAWSRKSSRADISPLVAVTLALRRAEQMRETVYETRGVAMISLD